MSRSYIKLSVFHLRFLNFINTELGTLEIQPNFKDKIFNDFNLHNFKEDNVTFVWIHLQILKRKNQNIYQSKQLHHKFYIVKENNFTTVYNNKQEKTDYT